MREASIGVLLPSSSIYPIGKQFEKGLRSGLSEVEGISFDIIPEFIGQGGIKEVEEAINKLKNFHDVDFITGWVSNKTAAEAADKLKGGKPFLINNLGEHIPNPTVIPSNVSLNSINLWQQLWSLGYWSVNKFGKKGMVVGALYDMGYCFSQVLDMGMQAASKDSKWSFAVCPLPEQGKLSDPGIVLDHAERDQPDFLFSAFCGEEATLFLEEYLRRGLQSKIPLISTPFLLENFDAPLSEALKVYTPIMSYSAMDDDALNQDWTKTFGSFYQLGLESGEQIVQHFNSVDHVSGARGRVNVEVKSAGKNAKVFIVENLHGGNKEALERSIITEVETVDMTNESIIDASKGTNASWLNHYLGI